MESSTETVLVTGASSGIGAAVARRFARDGARLVLVARRRDRLEALASELGVPAHLVELDVRDRGAVEAAVAALPEPFRAVTVLVNNAGLALGQGPAHEASLDDWDAMVDTNVKGLLHVTHALLPGMVARRRGHVVNLGSVAGTYPYPGGHVYCATKAFVHQFSLALRSDLLGTDVRVTCVEPGMVQTDFSTVRFGGDEARAAKVYQGADPMLPEDIAEAVAWCAAMPARVNVNTVELMATRQAFAPYAVHRS
jgi:NADP-dependent 3-hydroxy acid dehydrogenase YdfG